MLTDEQAGRLLGNTVRHKLAGGTNVYTLDLSAYKPLRPAFWRAFFETVANDLAVWAALSWQTQTSTTSTSSGISLNRSTCILTVTFSFG